MNLVVQVTRAPDGVIWAVRTAKTGTLIAAVHSSGEVVWYTSEPPSVAVESLVGALREWCATDQAEYHGLNERKLRASLPASR